MLRDQGNIVSSAPILDSKKCILSLSEQILTDSEEAELLNGFKFRVAHAHSRLPHTLRHGIEVQDQAHVRGGSFSTPNVAKKELKAVRFLVLNKDIAVLQTFCLLRSSDCGWLFPRDPTE